MRATLDGTIHTVLSEDSAAPADLPALFIPGKPVVWIAAGAMAGMCSDMYDVVNANDIGQVIGQVRPLINVATMTAGVALSVNRGVLQASALVPAGTE